MRCVLRCSDTQEKKKKVDWDDVEAKAKREAMWLLAWRKQQVRIHVINQFLVCFFN